MSWTIFAQQEFSAWLKLLDYGVVLAMLVAVVYGFYKAAVWFKIEVATPVVKRFMELIEVLRDSIPKQHETLVQSKVMLERQTISLGNMEGDMRGMRENTFEHLGLQHTEMVRLQEISDSGKALAEWQARAKAGVA